MAEWLGWNGPPMGRGSVEDVVSHTVPVVKALKTHATALAQDAAFNLDARAQRRTGDSQIRALHRGDSYDGFTPELDSYVFIEDPQGRGGGAGIEARHHVIGDAVDSAVSKAGL